MKNNLKKTVFLIFLPYTIFTQSLSFLKEPEIPSDSHQLDVIYVSPRGEIKLENIGKAREIILIFNHPMIELSTRSDVEKQNNYIPFEIHPPLRGKIHWYSPTTVGYQIEDHMIPGQNYEIIIRENLKSLKGSQIKSKKRYSFYLSKFQIQSVYPPQDEKLGLNEDIYIYFNYPVKPDPTKFIVYVNENQLKNDMDYSINFEDENNYKSVSINFKNILPPNSHIKIILDKELQTLANTILGEEIILNFETDDPLKIEFINQAKYYNDFYDIGFRFSNPVLLSENLDKIIITDKNNKKVRFRNLNELNSPLYFTSLLSWDVNPGEVYNVNINNHILDIYKTRYTGSQKFKVKIPLPRPDLYYKYGSYYSEACGSTYQLFQYANIKNVKLEAMRLSVFDLYKSYNLNLQNLFNNRFNIKKNKKNEIYEKFIPIKGDMWGTAILDFGSLVKKEKCNYGIILAKLYNKEIQKEYYQLIQFTDLGISVKDSPYRTWMWVQSLTKGNFLKDVNIKLIDNQKGHILGSCKTDSEGFCEVKKNANNKIPIATHLQYGNDEILFEHNYLNYLYTGIYTNSYSEKAELRGVIQFDRKLYRPGETVYFKIYTSYYKNSKFYSIKANQLLLKIEIRNSRGETIYNQNLLTDDYGTVADELELTETSSTGYYSISATPIRFLNQNQAMEGSINSNFYVEEFRPLTFTVIIPEIQNQYNYQIKSFFIEGRYLFGAPMIDAPIHISGFFRKTSISIKDFHTSYDDYYEIDYPQQKLFLRIVDKLDKKGKYIFKKSDFKENKNLFKFIKKFNKKNNIIIQPEFEMLNLKENFKINLEVKIFDSGGRYVLKQKEFMLFPSLNIPAIQIKNYFVKQNQNFEFWIGNFSSINNDFANHNEKHNIYIFKEEYNIVSTKANIDTLINEKTYTPILVYEKSLNIKNKEKIEFIPQKSGSYLIIVRNEAGAYAKGRFYVSGNDFSYWNEEDNLKLIPDKETYDIGDVAKVFIQSPFSEAKAILTIEQEDLFEKKVIHNLPSSYILEIPIKENYIPGIYISIMVLKERQKIEPTIYKNDPGKPQIRTGALYLNLNRKTRAIPLKISHSCPCKPGEEIIIKLNSVPDAQITLSVADRAVLDLINYHFTDPLPEIYSERSYFIKTYDNRNQLLDQYHYLATKNFFKGDEGGGGDTESSSGIDFDGDDGTRKNFRFTAYWNHNILTDKKGEAIIIFKLPDNVTTFRIMASVVKDNQYGIAEEEFQVKKELILLPVIPNFLRIGESIEIGTLLINNSLKKQNIEILFRNSHNFCNETKTKLNTNLTIDSQQTYPLFWSCKLDENKFKTLSDNITKTFLGEVELVWEAKSENFRDKILQKLEVLSEPYRETSTHSGIFKKKYIEKIQIPDFKKNPGFLKIDVSSTITNYYKNSLTYFELNPYLCFEQRASAYVLNYFSKKNNINKTIHGNYNSSNVEQLFLGEMNEFIDLSGGFKLWKDSQPDIFLTIYILDILDWLDKENIISKKNYIQIINNAFRYIENEFNKTNRFTQFSFLEFISYYYFVLFKYHPDKVKNNIDDFVNFINKNNLKLSMRGKGFLIYILNSLNKNNELQQLLYKDFENSLRFTGRKIYLEESIPYYSSQSTYYSSVSSLYPWMLYLLQVAQSDLISKIMQGLFARNIYYTSSLEEAYLSKIIDLYKQKFEKESQANFILRFDEKAIIKKELNQNESFWSSSFDFEKHPFLNQIQIENQSESPIYFNISLDYAISYSELQPVDEGIEIQKEIYYLNESKNSYELLKPQEEYILDNGQIYLIKLKINTTKPIQNFVIRDPISSLTEIVNLNLQSEYQNLIDSGDFYYYHKEVYKDKYIIMGSYLFPGYNEFIYLIRPISRGKGFLLPATAQALYEPEIYGRSKSFNILVR